MHKGFDSLAGQAQTVLGQDPFSGHVFCFRGRAAGRDQDIVVQLAIGHSCAVVHLIKSENDAIYMEVFKFNNDLS
jgi:hypothetical protein